MRVRMHNNMDRQIKANLTYKRVGVVAKSKGLPVALLWQSIADGTLRAKRANDCSNSQCARATICRTCMHTTGLWVDQWIHLGQGVTPEAQDDQDRDRDGAWQTRVVRHAAWHNLNADADEWEIAENAAEVPSYLSPLPGPRPTVREGVQRAKRHDYSVGASRRDMAGLAAKDARHERHLFEATTSLPIRCAWEAKAVVVDGDSAFVYWCILYGYDPVSWIKESRPVRVGRPQTPDDYHRLLENYQSTCPTHLGTISWLQQIVLVLQFTGRLLNGVVQGKMLQLLESGEKIDGLEPEEARELARSLRQKWLRDVRDDYTPRDRKRQEFCTRSGPELMDKVKIRSKQSGGESDAS